MASKRHNIPLGTGKIPVRSGENKKDRQQNTQNLRLNRNLTEFEEEYIDTWINKYKFSMQIIEEALRKTAGKANPSFKYVQHINSLAQRWY